MNIRMPGTGGFLPKDTSPDGLLFVSYATVTTRVSLLLTKLAVRDRAQVAVLH
jgi:hypothetical protein